MKFATLFIVSLALSLNSCRNTALNLTGGGSTLQGVYDDDYSLRIGRVSGEANLYQFETCLTAAHLSKQGSSLNPEQSCVPALQDRGESITFYAVPAADKLALSEDEQRSLLKVQREWDEYKSKQASFSSHQGAGALVGSAAVIGGALTIGTLALGHEDAKNGLKEAEEVRQKLWDEKLNMDGSQEPNWYNKYVGTVDKKSAVKEIMETEEKLKAWGYSTTSTGAEIGSKGHIFSDDFINHMKSPKITEYLAKNNVQDDVLSILKRPYRYSSGSNGISFEYIVRTFVNKLKIEVSDIIHPEILDNFMEYRAINEFYRRYNHPRDIESYLKNMYGDPYQSTRNRKVLNEFFTPSSWGGKYESKLAPEILLRDMESFAKNKGIPDNILKDINKNKVILENLRKNFPDSVLKNTSMTLSDMFDTFKKSEVYMDPARKLAKESADNIAAAIGGSLAVLIVGAAVTIAILTPKGKSVQEAKGALAKKELNFDNLSVLLQESSPLTSMDPYNNARVPSIKDVLAYVSLAWGGVNFENKATHYCVPGLKNKDTVTADCQPQGSSWMRSDEVPNSTPSTSSKSNTWQGKAQQRQNRRGK